MNPCVPVRDAHYAGTDVRRVRVLRVTTVIGALVSAGFGFYQLTLGPAVSTVGILNLLTAAAFLAVPQLYRFGDVIAPLTFAAMAYGSLFFITTAVGTGAGLLFYYPVAAAIVVLILGAEHIVLAGSLAVLAVVMAITLILTVPADTGLQPTWSMTTGLILSIGASALMAFAAVWFALRETARAEAAMDMEYQRSEQLLANILPASIAARLKDPDRTQAIADRYDDAAILFADIAGFTERGSTGWRRSKPPAMPTWWSAGCRSRAPTTCTRWPIWPWTWRTRWRRCAASTADRSRSGSVWPAAPSWPAWWGRAGSSTTCGAMPSTSRPEWNLPMSQDEFRCRTTSMNGCVANSGSRSAAMWRSRAKV